MGHRNYERSEFDKLNAQHNIMAFVGNGFDIQVLKSLGANIDTRYRNFFYFLTLHSFDDDNVIYGEMRNLQDCGKENWSDVEDIVSNLLTVRRASPQDLNRALRELQGKFAEFLTLVVPSHLLADLGTKVSSRNLTIQSLSKFLGDLDPKVYQKLGFPGRVAHFDLYNFLFVNFNYTPLLDDFIYLDQEQFDPSPYKIADRNFDFHGNPRRVAPAPVSAGDYFSSYLLTDVVHPHGYQGVPRSLLFGIDEPEHSGNADPALRLAKPFWAQNERRYRHLFDNTELFIVFGCSLGASDRWWWRRISEALGQERKHRNDTYYQPELIIYWFNGGKPTLTENAVRGKFFEAAGVGDDEDKTEYVHVVLHADKSDHVWLNTQ